MKRCMGYSLLFTQARLWEARVQKIEPVVDRIGLDECLAEQAVRASG